MAETKPNPFFDPAVASRLMSQMLLTPFPMEGNMSGHHRSPHRGSSVEFAEYRTYVPGDDLRRLDWRVYAKTDRFFVKEFEAETNLRCYCVLDGSGSMKFSGTGEPKFDFARRLISTLAYLVIQQGDAAGLVCIGEKTFQDIPPRRNPSHLQILFQTLVEAKPRGETGLIPALHELAEKIGRRALVIVVSDFFCDPEELMSALQHLRFQKHDVIALHLMDRMELDFQFERPIRFDDLESSGHLVTEPNLIRNDYLFYLNRHLERIETGCREFHAEYQRVVTDRDYEKVLADFLVERAGRVTV